VSGQAADDWYRRLHILRSADNKQQCYRVNRCAMKQTPNMYDWWLQTGRPYTRPDSSKTSALYKSFTYLLMDVHICKCSEPVIENVL